MQKYVAFISGLPIGRNAISADQLRSALIRLGFANVEPFFTSGNVAFETAPVGVIAPLEAQISRHLKRTFNLDDVWTFIRTPDELSSLLRDIPFDREDVEAQGNSIFMVLLPAEPDAVTARKLRIRRNEVDELRLARREIYWLRRKSDEQVPPPPISEILDAPATVRSLHTIRQIVDALSKPKAKAGRVKPIETSRSERSRQ
jgi:uncharacterized protein (DUF1697 family)